MCDKSAISAVRPPLSGCEHSEKDRYFEKKPKIRINKKIENILDEVFSEVAEKGIDKVIRKDNLKKIYYKHIQD